MSLTIGPVINRPGSTNYYCGPAILSALVPGMDTGQAARLLRHITGRRAIIGTSSWALMSALNQCGIICDWVIDNADTPPRHRPTLASWLRDTHSSRGKRVFLISAGKHWQLVQGRRYVCGNSERPVDLKHRAVARRSRIKLILELDCRMRIPPQIPRAAIA